MRAERFDLLVVAGGKGGEGGKGGKGGKALAMDLAKAGRRWRWSSGFPR